MKILIDDRTQQAKVIKSEDFNFIFRNTNAEQDQWLPNNPNHGLDGAWDSFDELCGLIIPENP
jgi:hypothetical protein